MNAIEEGVNMCHSISVSTAVLIILQKYFRKQTKVVEKSPDIIR